MKVKTPWPWIYSELPKTTAQKQTKLMASSLHSEMKAQEGLQKEYTGGNREALAKQCFLFSATFFIFLF